MAGICIHQAADKIGGNCVEIVAGDGRRLLVDAGRPLELKQGQKASLPPSLNLESPIEGLVLSHSHADHSGLLAELPPGWPLICGEDTAFMLRFNQDFRKKTDLQTWPRANKPASFAVGPFRITAFNVDHSAFDAYALLIEVDGRRIFYSGDFRGHGRKMALTEKFLKKPPADIDVLIMEGTSLPAEGKAAAAPPLTEADLEKQFAEVFRRTVGRVFVSWAAGNIDRMVTLFRACRRTGRRLAIDLYTALIWEEMGRFAKLPALTRETPIRVVVTQKVNEWLKKLGFENPARHFIKAKAAIPARVLEENPGQWVAMARNGLARSGYAGKVHPTAADAWVWSQWAGYLKDEAQTIELKKFLAPCGEPLLIHSSGHAPPELLARLAKALNPMVLLPIHGEAWPRHQADFANLKILDNGQWLEI